MTDKFEWHKIGKDQPLRCHIGKISIFKFPDGHATCSVNQVYISALFESPEAALSWRNHWDEAEKMFFDINPPDGKGGNALPARVEPRGPKTQNKPRHPKGSGAR